MSIKLKNKNRVESYNELSDQQKQLVITNLSRHLGTETTNGSHPLGNLEY